MRRISALWSVVAVVSLACGNRDPDKADPGSDKDAVDQFRAFAAKEYPGGTFEVRAVQIRCETRVDVEKTSSLASPYVGIVRATITGAGQQETIEARFTREQDGWVCDPTAGNVVGAGAQACAALRKLCLGRLPKRGPGELDPIKLLQAHVDEMCACKDRTCSAAVDQKTNQIQWRLATEVTVFLTEDEETRMTALYTKLWDCKGAHGDGGLAVEFMLKYRNETCACADKTCVQGVETRMAEEGKKLAGQALPAPSVNDQKKLEEIMKKITECRQRAM